MNFRESIKQMLRDELGGGIFPATVVSVDETERTFDVKDVEGTELYDVSMQSVTGLAEGMYLVPAIGSQVLVISLGVQLEEEDAEYVGLACAEVQKLIVETGSSSLQVLPGSIVLEDVVALGGGRREPGVKGTSLNTQLTQLNTNLATLITALATFATAQAAAAAASPSPTLAPAFSALLIALTTQQTSVAGWTSTLSNHLSQKVSLA